MLPNLLESEYFSPNPNTIKWNGQLLMHYVCGENKRTDILRNLLEDGRFDLNIKDDCGMTPLCSACIYGHLDIVQILVENTDGKVNLMIRDNISGLTPFDYACKQGHANIVRFLCENIKIRKEDIHLNQAFGNIEIFKYLLTFEETDLNEQNIHHNTILYTACGQNLVDIIELLVNDERLDPNKQNNQMETPLHYVCSHSFCDDKIFELLLDNEHINLNIKDKYDNSPLHYLADICHEYRILSFMQHPNMDADGLNMQNINGMTAFHILSEKNDVELVKLFLDDERVDVNIKNSGGWTAYQCALRNHSREVAELLRKDPRIIRNKPIVNSIPANNS